MVGTKHSKQWSDALWDRQSLEMGGGTAKIPGLLLTILGVQGGLCGEMSF